MISPPISPVALGRGTTFITALLMGRKRNQGKARKAAAKAKAQQEEEERAEDGLQHHEREQAEQLQQLPFISEAKVEFQKSPPSDLECRHGSQCASSADAPYQLTEAFLQSFYDANNVAVENGLSDSLSIAMCLEEASQATLDKFADVWKDSAKMEMAISCFLRRGTNAIREDKYDYAGLFAVIARFFEQHIAVELKQTQALYNWPKVDETFYSDEHTLVKFYRHRIPCSCLDEKYEEVKHITKMGYCYSSDCKFSSATGRAREGEGGGVERSKAKYCSRCRCATYCSRKCQEADWKIHKPHCDYDAAIIAKFEAKKQSSVDKFAEREVSSPSATAKAPRKKSPAKKAKMKETSKPKTFATPADDNEVKIPGVSTDKIKAKIESIVANADKDSFTVKDVREELEDWLDMNLAEYKESIRTLVMDVM